MQNRYRRKPDVPSQLINTVFVTGIPDVSELINKRLESVFYKRRGTIFVVSKYIGNK